MSVLEKLGSGLDKIIAVLSPETAARRTRARISGDTAKRYYEGATKGRRGDGWRVIDGGPKDALKGLKTLRDRSRDFNRNNAYAKKAVGGICSNTIGTGIVLQFRGEAKRQTKLSNDAWKSWYESTACDFDGVNTGYGLQNLAFRTIVESGEVFIRKVVLDSKYAKKTGKVPLQIQLLEPEFIDDSRDNFGLPTGHQVVSGIEFNARGQRVAYYVFQTHPSSYPFNKSVRVPASEIRHVFRVDRPGQIRGVPWGASAFLNLHDLDGYEDSELIRRKLASCMVGFVATTEAEEITEVNGSSPLPEVPLVDRMEPGIIEMLPPGKSISFSTPPSVTGYSEYATSVLHKIASGFDVPYSVLTGDYSQVNFSSGRMGWLEFQRSIDQWRWTLFVPKVLEPILDWFSEIAELTGISTEGLSHEWTAPRREMIDPLKEVNATILEVKAGLLSMPEAIKERGYDPNTQVDEMKAWNAKLDAAKITLDSDPRKDPKRMLAENVVTAAEIKDTANKQAGKNNEG